MTYRERQRLADIQAAIEAIRSHRQRGDLDDLDEQVAARLARQAILDRTGAPAT